MSERFESLEHWLKNILKSSDFELVPASEDASFRFYYRLSLDNKTFIVMDAPPQHEDCSAFIEITNKLHDCNVNAPTIHEMDLEQGYLLLSDFGNDLYLDKLNHASVNELYSDAIKALVSMQVLGSVEGLNNYDESLLRNEINIFKEWLLGRHLRIELNNRQTESIESLFDLLVKNALQQPQVLVHRDFHSRNLMLTKEKNPGVIDYQDAVGGPISYDLVSLLKDCYIKWPKNMIDTWVDFYLNKLVTHGFELEIDREEFQRWFDLMGVQRHLKASGIFARLFHRDNKQGFLKDIPRTLSYIVDLKQTYDELFPLCLLIEESILPRLKES